MGVPDRKYNSCNLDRLHIAAADCCLIPSALTPYDADRFDSSNAKDSSQSMTAKDEEHHDRMG